MNKNKYSLDKFSNTCGCCGEKIKIINGVKFVCRLNSFDKHNTFATIKSNYGIEETKCKRPFYGTCLQK